MSFQPLRRFWRESSGAVTLDWVVLTAGVVGFGVATYSMIDPGLSGLGNAIGEVLGSLSTDPSLDACKFGDGIAALSDADLRAAHDQAIAAGDAAKARQTGCAMQARGLN